MASCAELAKKDDGEEIILMEGTVLCGGFKMDLLLTNNHLKYQYQEEPVKKKNVETSSCLLFWHDIITAEIREDKTGLSLKISYIMEQKNKKLCIKELIVTCSDGNEQKWLSIIKEQCGKVSHRPRKVLVVINPIGGNGKGEKTYHRQVEPILKKAGIEAQVIVTERAKHALEIGETFDFTGIEGILTVGGDGIYQEVVQGYFIRLQKMSSLELTKENLDKFIKLEIPMCPIPSGSSNGLARYTNNGVMDAITSTLRVVKGEVNKVNILAVFERNKFMGVCCLGCATGFMVDMMKSADEKRWMKKYRYAYCITTSLLKKRHFFNLSLEFLTSQRKLPLPDDESTSEEKGQEGKDPAWVTFDSKGKGYTSASLFSCNVDTSGDHSIVNFHEQTCCGMVDTGMSNMEMIKSTTVWYGKKLKNPIPDFHLMCNLEGMRYKILRDESETDENVSGTRAKHRDLEHYVFMDGEIKRTDTPEVEARLLGYFLPMFSSRPTRS